MNYLERLAPILFLLMWSSGAIFVKMGLENASVWSFLTLRATGAFLLMGVIYLCFKINKALIFIASDSALINYYIK